MSKLDEAKINLKSVLERLEKALDNALKSTAPQNEEEISKLRNDFISLRESNNKLKLEFEDKISEIKYLREENYRLQAEAGELKDSNIKLQAKNNEAIRRVDMIIDEFKNYVTTHAA